MRKVADRRAEPSVRPVSPLIELCGVEKVYRAGKLEYAALRGVDLTIWPGEMVAVVGPSGSGKTTILNLITGIDRPTAGRVIVDGADLAAMSQERLARWRGQTVGIVFQFFQLLPTLTALENAALPMDFARRWKAAERWERARRHLGAVGLGDKADHLPLELSGGEQQRVAIARALANNPKLLLADEPTGQLDLETARQIMRLLRSIAHGEGITAIVATHDPALIELADRVLELRDGALVN